MYPYIELKGLTFNYPGGEPLFTDLSLSVEAGACFGILGPNGAGKTTMMKLMLGLLRARHGGAYLFGRSPLREKTVFDRTGILVEGPHLYPHLSGRDNLRVQATYRGAGPQRIAAVLREVGLDQAADRQVRQYSTGMKQRLALAIALLPDPDLLFLDEPSQGLDPQGIADMRRTIQQLHRERGKTILLSSHLLGEVEQICTHLVVLDRGNLLFLGTLSALRDRFPAMAGLEVEVDAADKARRLLEAAGFTVSLNGAHKLLVELEDRAQTTVVVDRLRKGQVAIYALQPQQQRLEELFLGLLAENAHEKPPQTGSHA